MTKNARLRAAPYCEEFESTAAFLAAGYQLSANGGHVSDPRLEYAAAGVGANEQFPSEGGFLVAPSVTNIAVIEKAQSVAPLLSRLRRIPMNRRELSIPSVSESSRANGSRYGGLALAWGNEGGTTPDSKPKWGRLTFASNKCAGVVYLSNELFGSTAGGAVFEHVAGVELGLTLTDAVINGTGSGQPLGILNSDACIAVTPPSGLASGSVTPECLKSMVGRFWAGSFPTGVWLMNVPAFEQLSTASFDNGQPCFTYEGGRRWCLGFEILVTEFCAPVGSRGDVILADFGEYVIAERETGIIASLDVKFLTDEAALKIRFRGDAMPAWSTPVTVADGSGTTVSPYVVCATR